MLDRIKHFFSRGPFDISQLSGRGIEIGAHGLPIEGISPIYVDRFREFAGARCKANVLADASALAFKDDCFDYVASSHLLEHLPDPIRALDEWYRVLKGGGLLYVVVPDRRYTFDHRRARTPLAHIVEDFERKTTEIDGTHIDEFFTDVDMARLCPEVPPAELENKRATDRQLHHAAVQAGRPINLHFHVFEKEDVLAMLRFASSDRRLGHRWELIDVRERYPPNRGDGFLIVLRSWKHERLPSRVIRLARHLVGRVIFRSLRRINGA